MSGELATASEKFNDNLTKIGTSLDALKIQSMSGVIEGLETLTDRFVKATKASGGFFSGLGIWVRTSGDEESNPGKYVTELNAKLIELQKTRDALSSSSIKRLFNTDDIAIVDTQIDGMTKQLKYLQELLPSAQAEAGWSPYQKRSQASGITDTPAVPKPVSLVKQIDEGQKLIQQLKERLLSTQELTEVEKLQAQFADARYAKATAGERDIALGIAGQIDARKNLLTDLDNELAAVKEITAEYEKQDARLQSLIDATPAAQNSQKMVDEALAESALRSGKIDTTTYDQIIGKLNEIKEEGKDTFLDLTTVANDAARTMADGFVNYLFDPMNTSIGDMLANFLKATAKMMAQAAMLSLVKQGMSAMGFSGFAKGGAFDGGVQAFASGGVVNRPTPFKFASGGSFKSGVMGEAGPEAILPLKRGSDGKLGVTMNGNGSTGGTVVNVTVNHTGDRKDEKTDGSDGAMKEFAGMIKNSVLQVIVSEKRPGGLLYA